MQKLFDFRLFFIKIEENLCVRTAANFHVNKIEMVLKCFFNSKKSFCDSIYDHKIFTTHNEKEKKNLNRIYGIRTSFASIFFRSVLFIYRFNVCRRSTPMFTTYC